MGLDMYAYATRDLAPASDVDFVVSDDASPEEIYYWRKHPDLHGWMQRLYTAKGGTDADFNCVNLRLREEDLLSLRNHIRMKMLPKTTGFFFGQSDGSESDDDLKFVETALGLVRHRVVLPLARVQVGEIVYYRAWY